MFLRSIGDEESHYDPNVACAETIAEALALGSCTVGGRVQCAERAQWFLNGAGCRKVPPRMQTEHREQSGQLLGGGQQVQTCSRGYGMAAYGGTSWAVTLKTFGSSGPCGGAPATAADVSLRPAGAAAGSAVTAVSVT